MKQGKASRIWLPQSQFHKKGLKSQAGLILKSIA